MVFFQKEFLSWMQPTKTGGIFTFMDAFFSQFLALFGAI